MRKRIGSRDYNTESSELIQDVGIGLLYRKRTRGREWFLLIGDDLEPVSDDQARALLGDSVYVEHQPEPQSWMIRVDKETHDRITTAAYIAGISASELVRQLSLSL